MYSAVNDPDSICHLNEANYNVLTWKPSFARRVTLDFLLEKFILLNCESCRRQHLLERKEKRFSLIFLRRCRTKSCRLTYVNMNTNFVEQALNWNTVEYYIKDAGNSHNFNRAILFIYFSKAIFICKFSHSVIPYFSLTTSRVFQTSVEQDFQTSS